MKIFEVEDKGQSPDVSRLVALVSFLHGRYKDEASQQRKMPTRAFLNAARDVGVNLDEKSLETVINPKDANQPSLFADFIEPYTVGQQFVQFKGGSSEEAPAQMPVDKARDIVAARAKSALKREQQ